MVAAAVARRAGVSDELLDEVRLAIGEACTARVARAPPARPGRPDRGRDERRRPVHRAGGRPRPVGVGDPGAGRDHGAIMAEVAAETGRPGLDEDMLTFGVGLALLTGLVSDLEVAAAKTAPAPRSRCPGRCSADSQRLISLGRPGHRMLPDHRDG
jgi:hypothetical protein